LLRLLLFIFLTPLVAVSQTVTGKLYGDKTTAKNVKIQNVQKAILTYSDENGDFIISASIGDSLTFKSLFYNEKVLVVKKEHLNQTIVVQIKKVVNNLDEVLLSGAPKFKEFNAVEYNTKVNIQIENDKKNRPYLYTNYRSGGVDFVAIAQLIGKLFKKKNKPEPIQYVTYKELDFFFNNDAYFNGKLLHDDLNINEVYRFLFFDYCEARKIDKALLSGNQMILLDIFITYSTDFLKIIDEYKE